MLLMGDQMWSDNLAVCGWPTTVVVIDFETYFDTEYSLAKMPEHAYVNDARFEFTAVGVAILRGDEEEHLYVPGPQVEEFVTTELPERVGGWGSVTVVAQYVPFDGTILKKLGIHPPYILDLKYLSNHYEARGSSRLADIATRLKLASGEKGDTLQFRGLRYKELSDDQRERLEAYTRQDVRLESEALKILLPKVTNPTVELPIMRHTLALFLYPTLRFDLRLAGRIQVQMQKELNDMVARTGLTLDKLRSDAAFVAALQDALPDGESVPVKAHKKPSEAVTRLLGRAGVGPALARTDPEAQQLLNHPEPRVRQLMAARFATRSWPNHIKRITSMKEYAIAAGGKLPVPLHYYGGHTGRWSGAGGINLQNLGARGGNELINSLRSTIMAPAGSRLIIVDWSAVEARGLAWLAGQDDLIEQYRRNEDVYSRFATRLFEARVRKPRHGDPPALASLMKVRRQFGKMAVLGLGYGMGASTFYDRLKSDPLLSGLISSGKLTYNVAAGAAMTYRRTYPAIPIYWDTVERAFRTAIRNGEGRVFTIPQGRVAFRGEGHTVYLRLPSGRELRYPGCYISSGSTRAGEIKWKYGYLWGGGITENIVQATCRDLLAEAILRCEEAGHRVVFHCHDELVCCVPTSHATLIYADICRIMETPPGWAKGFPLAVEGKVSKRYEK